MSHKVEETVPKPYYTADMVRAMPDDGNRYEVVYGELLVTPSPRAWHQKLVIRLAARLEEYLNTFPSGVAFTSPADISWGKDVLVQPDVFVASHEEAQSLEWPRIQNLLLIAEVLSPSTSRQDRFVKRRRYQEAGVLVYWVVDGDERLVEVWTPSDNFPTIERQRLSWSPVGANRPFVLELQELFRPV